MSSTTFRALKNKIFLLKKMDIDKETDRSRGVGAVRARRGDPYPPAQRQTEGRTPRQRPQSSVPPQ